MFPINIPFLSKEMVTTFSNIMYIFILFYAAVIYLFYVRKHKKVKQIQKEEKEIDIYKERLRKEKMQSKAGPISDYLNLLENYFTEREVKKPFSYVKVTILGVVIISLLAALYSGILMGLIVFLILNLLISIIIKNLNENKSSGSEYNLPEVIDVIIRSFSKSDEIQTVIYETSLAIDKPFKDMFSTMAREMTSSGHLSVLNKYKQRTNSIWLNSLFSILIKYKEDAKKEDTLVNLRYLRTMIAQENALKRKSISDKRYNVALNYILSTVGVVGNIITFLFFTDKAVAAYLRSPFGLLMLFLGYASVFGVIIITKKLGNKSDFNMEGKK